MIYTILSLFIAVPLVFGSRLMDKFQHQIAAHELPPANDTNPEPIKRRLLSNAQIRSQYNHNKCVDCSTRTVDMAACDGSAGQRFTYDSSTQQIRDWMNECLDFNFQGDFEIITYPCMRTSNQRWTISGNNIISAFNRECLDYNYGNGGLYTLPCHNGNSQKWD
eukprot:87192_1